MDTLSAEIFVEIFKYLHDHDLFHVSVVCRQFEEVSQILFKERCNVIVSSDNCRALYSTELSLRLEIAKRDFDYKKSILSLYHEKNLRASHLRVFYPKILFLERLNLFGCTINSSFFHPHSMNYLEKLTLNKCFFYDFPKNIGKMKELVLMKAKFYDNKTLLDIVGIQTIRKISMIDCHLRQVPFLNTQLTEINLMNNKIREIPKEIIKFSNLIVLNLRSNLLSEVPQLPKSLRIIDLSQNKLTIFPEHLRELPSLKKLDISHNEIRDVPFEMPSLELYLF